VNFDQLSDLEGFDWDEGNREKNRVKHNVSDGECEEIFFNSPLLLTDDAKHSGEESRFAAFCITNAGRMLTVVFTVRQQLIRVISARDVNRKERRFVNDHEEDPEI